MSPANGERATTGSGVSLSAWIASTTFRGLRKLSIQRITTASGSAKASRA
jgi:hypothetical protein